MSNEKESRYPWADAPEWATHAATEKNGCGYWYGLVYTPDGWRHKWQQIGGVFYGTDYGATLEARPIKSQSAAEFDRERLRERLAGQIFASLVQNPAAHIARGLGITYDVGQINVILSKMAVAKTDALLATLYPSPNTES